MPDAPPVPEPRVPASEVSLTTPIAQIAGVRRDRAAALAALGVRNVGTLIAHIPFRYEHEEAESPIASLEADRVVSARGQITATRVVRGRGRKARFEAVLVDESGRLDLVWFGGTYLRGTLHPGVRVRVQGKSRRRGPSLQLANPSYEILRDEGDHDPAARNERLRPIYPASEAITSRQIEQVIDLVLDRAAGEIEDHLDEAYRREREMPSLRDAYRMIHRPGSEAEIAGARRRLAYDELLLLQLGVHLKRAQARAEHEAPALPWSESIDRHIRGRLPFELTPSQSHVVGQIARDLAHPTPVNRLIQGDVGSGKTVVALYAMLMAVAAGHQAALMAPTELLAEQHFASITSMLEGSRVRVELLTGTLGAAERDAARACVAGGEADIVIGTHAIIGESVRFRSLALAVIDEQHRFGVHQRATLRTRGTGPGAGGSTGGSSGRTLVPHVLVMTATPIPRTLAITLFGDLDVSTIDGLPPGRKPVRTRVVDQAKRDEVYNWLRGRLETGEQAYIVVPAIDSGAGELRDVRGLLAELEQGALAGLRVAALHGRLKRTTREHIMHRFRTGKIDALLATTVIEVGVDVPNASVMVVEHAERFGLAQLHQLRGRVGRGERASVCVLIGEETTPEAGERLRTMAETSDGFRLAERDFEIRGPGEVFGARQAGAAPFRVADLSKDLELLTMARRDAASWIERSPRLDRPEDRIALRRLMKAHGEWLGLGDVG